MKPEIRVLQKMKWSAERGLAKKDEDIFRPVHGDTSTVWPPRSSSLLQRNDVSQASVGDVLSM
jgi:hypothetical protein